ncbi:MAG: peptide chain release factor N(5)-glutamine methyltransferase [Synergistaceae bacterium]|nr:peptide chain release factor N(5)-glutamine methyltransferase [Synergistaceae bacterium]
MNLGYARRFIVEAFRDGGIHNATGEADLILIRLLRVSRAFVMGHPEKILTGGERAYIDKAVARRLAGEPLQYILGEAHFWGISFEVGEGTLIPRPETEFLVEAALKRLPSDSPSFFLDWGTGSGCITIALLMERPLAKAIMAEKNPRSIYWAWRNLKRNGLHGRALLWHSREPDDIPVRNGSLDLAVSNPPYIPTKEIDGLMREVRCHEPHMALDGGEDGMDFYRKLFRGVPVMLKEGGALIMEMGGIAPGPDNGCAPGMALTEETADFSGNLRCMVWERRA